MTHYAEFYHVDLAGQVSRICGIDGTIRLDGRYGLVRSVNAALRHQARLRALGQLPIGFQLFYKSEQPYYSDLPRSQP